MSFQPRFGGVWGRGSYLPDDDLPVSSRHLEGDIFPAMAEHIGQSIGVNKCQNI